MAKACFLMCPNDAAGIEEMEDKPRGDTQDQELNVGGALPRIGKKNSGRELLGILVINLIPEYLQ